MEPSETLFSLFDSKKVGIIKLFLREEGKQYYLREIAKLAKVSPASTYRILKKLTAIQVLKMTEIKTAKLYSLESNKTVDFLKSILEVDIVQYFIEKASQVTGVEEIYLYGKKEKNRAVIFIIGSNIDANQLKVVIGDVKAKYSFNILDMCFTKEQYEQGVSHGLYPEMKKNLYKRA